jgi:hypothetical protein
MSISHAFAPQESAVSKRVQGKSAGAFAQRQRGSTDERPPEFGEGALDGTGDVGTSDIADPPDGGVEGGTGAGGV